MINKQTVTAASGEKIPIKADTVCIHGDGENALEFAKTIRENMLKNGVEVSAIWHFF
jgi:5-oxoprolinase (ATP-hydrolysing) subunit A